MNKVKLILIVFITATLVNGFTTVPDEQVKWISFEELALIYKSNPKPILVDVYTNWCGWCKVMDKKTYTNQKLVKYLNEKYYAVKFDAESKETLTFNGKQYGYDTKNKVHQLALYLTFGRLEFPHTVLLQAEDTQPAPISGYLKPKQLEMPIKFFGEKASISKTFVEFNKGAKSEW